MKYVFIYIFALLALASVVWGVSCPDQFELSENCTMITPPLNCASATYDILNYTSPDFSGSTVRSGSLVETVSGSGLYSLNFTECDEGEGDYLVKLCDNTTRAVRCVTSPVNLSFISGQISEANDTIGLIFNIENNDLSVMLSCEPRVALDDTIICYVKAANSTHSGIQLDTLDVSVREPATGDIWDTFDLSDYTWDSNLQEYYDIISIGPVETKGDYHVVANASKDGKQAADITFFTISDVGYFDIILNLVTETIYRGSPFTFNMTVSQVSGASGDLVYRYRLTTGDGQQSTASQVLFTEADSLCATLTCPHVVTMNAPFTQNRENGELCVQLEREDGSIVKAYDDTCISLTVHIQPVDSGAGFVERARFVYQEYHSNIIIGFWVFTIVSTCFFIIWFAGKRRKKKNEESDL